MERSRRRRAITPQARKRLNRRRRASTALTTLMVAGPAGQVLAASGATVGGGDPGPTSPVDRAIGAQPGALMLEAGSTGAAVQAIQERLGVAADGVYGPVTEGAVRDFQARTGLLVDGIVGPITWTKLFGLERAAVSAGAARGGVAVIVREREPAERDTGYAGPSEAGPSEAGPSETAIARTVPAIERGPSSVRPAGRRQTDAEPPAPAARPAPAPPTSGACGALRLATPVNGVRTSPFGPREGRNHDGVDIAAPTGTPVRAAECGVVTVRGVQDGYGNMVCVQHSDRFETCYAHLSRFAVDGGQTVRRGQVIGYVGCTGHCTGPHVHFETRLDGEAQNPDAYLNGASVPGKPRVSQASLKRPARAKSAARPVGTESGWRRAAPASTGESASSMRRPPARQSATGPVEQEATVEQAAAPAAVPTYAPAEPVVAEQVPAPVAEQPPPTTAPTPPPAEPVVTEQAPAPLAEEQPAEAPVAETVPEVPVAEAPVAETVPEIPVAEAPVAETVPEVPVAQAPAPVATPAPAQAPSPVEPPPNEPDLTDPAATAEPAPRQQQSRRR